MKKSLIAFLMLTACTSADDLALLDHAQILAVRAEPAHAAPGDRVRIDVLAGDDAGNVFGAVPDSLLVGDLPVQRGADGWYVTASGPLAPTAEVTLAIDGTTWRATKQLVFGTPAANPAIAMMHVNGSESAAIDCAVNAKPALEVMSAGIEPLTYAWYTSLGKLEHSRGATPIFDANQVGEGTVAVVIRDAQGGVTWQTLPARVR